MLTEREHILIALRVQLRKVTTVDATTSRRFLAELAEGRLWIGKHLDARSETYFERIAQEAVRDIHDERRTLAQEAK